MVLWPFSPTSNRLELSVVKDEFFCCEMTSDGSEGLGNNVLLVEDVPVVCVGSGRAGAAVCTGTCARSLTSAFCHFSPFHLLTERKYV